jgi:hypothetical protein
MNCCFVILKKVALRSVKYRCFTQRVEMIAILAIGHVREISSMTDLMVYVLFNKFRLWTFLQNKFLPVIRYTALFLTSG